MGHYLDTIGNDKALGVLTTALDWGFLKSLPTDLEFVFTGKASLPRSQLHRIVGALGARAGTAVRYSTTHLVVGNDANLFKPTGKIKAAQDKGITVITESEFVNLVLGPTALQVL